MGVSIMKKIEEIEEDIEKLSKNELKAFRRWFIDFDTQLWDNQIQEDADKGKLNNLANEAIKEFREGKAKEL
jgi:hypothetical protein